MHISFDFDYTLADSSEGTVACATYALSRMDLPVPAPETIRRTVGLSLERTFLALTARESLDEALRFKSLFFEHADEVMLDHIRLFPGVPSLLNSLKGKGHYVSIVSTKLKIRIEQALTRDGLRNQVDDIVGGGCVDENKPHPEGLLLACERSGIARQATVYVGDSVSDGGCARAAGVPFIAVLSGKTGERELRRFQPLSVIQRVVDIDSLF